LPAGSSYLIQPTRGAARGITVNPALVADARLIAAAGTTARVGRDGQYRHGHGHLGQAGPGYQDAFAGTADQSGIQCRRTAATSRSVRACRSMALAAGDITALRDQGIAYTSGATVTLVGSASRQSAHGLQLRDDRFAE
jgi:hypothetical protein